MKYVLDIFTIQIIALEGTFIQTRVLIARERDYPYHEKEPLFSINFTTFMHFTGNVEMVTIKGRQKKDTTKIMKNINLTSIITCHTRMTNMIDYYLRVIPKCHFLICC